MYIYIYIYVHVDIHTHRHIHLPMLYVSYFLHSELEFFVAPLNAFDDVVRAFTLRWLPAARLACSPCATLPGVSPGERDGRGRCGPRNLPIFNPWV